MAEGNLAKHWALIERWVGSLSHVPAVDVVWLEGSLVGDRATPRSDIDLRLAITDAAFTELWKTNRTPLLEGLGEYLPLVTSFVRALTLDGIIVEAGAYRTSEISSLALHEWRVLFSRLPAGQPDFQQLPPATPTELWPSRETLTPKLVRELTNQWLTNMANDPATLFNGELHAARFALDDLRIEFIKLLYRRLGLQFAKRYKHLSEVLPAPWLADLERTYMSPSTFPLDPASIAAAMLALFDVVGKHIQALSEQAGGGFEPLWYARLYRQVQADLYMMLGQADVSGSSTNWRRYWQ
jgi:hypothetical protein